MNKFGFHQPNNHHHHRQQHLGPHSGSSSSSSNGWWGSRRKTYLLVLLVLIAVLVINMLLLMPQLHTTDHGAWHFAGSTSSSSGSSSGAGKTLTASGDPQQQQIQQIHQQQQQQLLLRSHGISISSSSVAAGDFVGVFDENHDGVLGPVEFSSLVQEACRNDRASLSFFQNIRRAVRLAFGFTPGSSSSGGGDRYPCTLTGDLIDSTWRAAAVIAGGGSSSSSGSSSKVGFKGGGVDSIRAASEKAVDPESPEGRAAARSAALLSSCSPLTPELAQAAASSDTVLLAAADWAMFELFGVNWLSHVQRAGLDNYLLAALDQRTADFLRSNKLGHCVLWSTAAAAAGDGPLPRQAAAYQPGSSAHRAASWSKLHVATMLLSWGYSVILSDLDTVWLTDPMPYFQTNVPNVADLVLATDDPANHSMMATSDVGLMVRPDPHAAVNPAVAFLRSTPATQAAVAAWLAEYQRYADSDGMLLPAYHQAVASSSSSSSSRGLLSAGNVLDGGGDVGPLFPAAVVRGWLQQRQSNGHLAAQPHPTDPSNRLLQLSPSSTAGSSSWSLFGGAKKRKAAVGVFSPVVMANGYSWFIQGVGSRAAVVRARGSSAAAAAAAAAAPGRKLPLAVHISRSGSSREGRLHRMREANWYADGPRYYTEPKLLSFTLKPFTSTAVTAGLANAPDYAPVDQLSLHIASLQYQLQQFYAAAAVAVALGRVLIIPQMQCFCYRDPESSPAGPASWLLSSSSSSRKNRLQQQQQQWSCRAPGDDATSFPFNCTLDQVFSPQLMYRHSAVFAGRPLNFREASFLSNRRTPSWLRHAATRISSGSPAGCDSSDLDGGSSDGSELVGRKCAQALPGKPPDGGNQQVIVPPNLADAELVTILKPFESAKYLHFTDITAVFNGTFANPNHKMDYERWLDKVVQPWCCKPAAAAAAAAEPAAGSSGMAEVATSAEGWAMIDVKARLEGSSTGSDSSSSSSSDSTSNSTP